MKGIGIGLILLMQFVLPSANADETGFRYGLSNTNQVFTEPDEAEIGSFFALNISGGVPARLDVELVDVFADVGGVKRAVPLNSTPFTANNYIEFEATADNYYPSEQMQVIKIPYKFKRIANLDRQIIGGLKISLTPLVKPENTSGLSFNSAIVGTFSYYPLNINTTGKSKLTPKLDITSVKFRPLRPDIFPLNLIPNLPRIISRGPVNVNVRMVNSGNVFLETQTNLSVTRASLFSGNSEVLFDKKGDVAMLIPGQAGEVSMNLTNQLAQSATTIDALPTIGIVRVSISIVGQIGTSELVTISSEKLLFLFPWKLAITVILLFGLGLLIRRRQKPVEPEPNHFEIDFAKEADAKIASFRNDIDQMFKTEQISKKNSD